jgi:hypothetical protein
MAKNAGSLFSTQCIVLRSSLLSYYAKERESKLLMKEEVGGKQRLKTGE